MFNDIYVGERIAKTRIQKGLSQSEFAEKIEVSTDYLNKIEELETVPPIACLHKIAKVFGLQNITDLFVFPKLQYDVFKSPFSKNVIVKGEVEDYKCKLLLGKNTIHSDPSFLPYFVKWKKTTVPVYHYHAGWEIIILLSGKLKLDFKTIDHRCSEVFELNPFDIALFKSNTPHSTMPIVGKTKGISIISDVDASLPSGTNIKTIPFHYFGKKPYVNIREIGTNIKKVRKQWNMSESDFAKRMGISPSYVTRIESNKIVPSFSSLCDIGDVLKFDIKGFFGSTGVQCDIFRYPFNKSLILDNEVNKNRFGYEQKWLLGKDSIKSPFHLYKLTHFQQNKKIFHKHNGWEFLLPFEGELKIYFKDDFDHNRNQEIKLNSLNTVLFRADTPHVYSPETSELKKITRSICVISGADRIWI